MTLKKQGYTKRIFQLWNLHFNQSVNQSKETSTAIRRKRIRSALWQRL